MKSHKRKKAETLLQYILKVDQSDRIKKSERGTLESEDKAHYVIAKLITGGSIKHLGAHSLYSLAMIFQHSGTVRDLRKAEELAKLAAAKGHPNANWLAAAIFDRRRIMKGKPQKYGTQFKRDPETGRLVLAPLDESCTDAERLTLGLPTLAEIRESTLTLS